MAACELRNSDRAQEYRNIDSIAFLISKGADVNETDGRGMTALMDAAAYGRTDVVAFLISKGADVNSKQTNEWTPLQMAASAGSLECIKLLVSHGAVLDPHDKRDSAFRWASM